MKRGGRGDEKNYYYFILFVNVIKRNSEFDWRVGGNILVNRAALQRVQFSTMPVFFKYF